MYKCFTKQTPDIFDLLDQAIRKDNKTSYITRELLQFF